MQPWASLTALTSASATDPKAQFRCALRVALNETLGARPGAFSTFRHSSGPPKPTSRAILVPALTVSSHSFTPCSGRESRPSQPRPHISIGCGTFSPVDVDGGSGAGEAGSVVRSVAMICMPALPSTAAW